MADPDARGRSSHEAIEEARRSGSLILDEVLLDELPVQVRRLRRLRTLILRSSGIRVLPDWLEELTELEFIEVSGSRLSTLPASLGELRRVRTLGLSQTEIAELPEVLRDMRSLEVLSLPGTHIRELPDWLGELSHLRGLDLGANRVSRLPESLGSLEHLTHLCLWGHAFPAIPDAIRDLPSLELLDVSRCGANDFSSEADRRYDWDGPFMGLGQLIGKTDDDATKLADLPSWIADLPQLRVLSAGGHRIEELPPRLPTTLRELWMGGNCLTTVPGSLERLPQLDVLDLSENLIDELPRAMRGLTSLTFLDLRENPLPMPPEVLETVDDPARILDFLRRVEGPTRRLDEAKLLVVGEGSVGKTSLVKRLVSNAYSEHEQKTEGIAVQRWDLDIDDARIALNVWDFGGQEIMHATHQFFLTKRSLYVLVIDARQGEEQNRIEYWLKLIHSFGGASPVIIVGNKTEQSVLDIDERGLREKYPNIIDILPLSCKSGAGIDDLHERLAAAIKRMPHVRDKLPAAYFDVKQALEQLDVDYLAYADYVKLCARHGVNDDEARESLIGFLHDLGTVLCFRDDPRLLDTNILNPEWVTGGVYRLLNSHVAAQRKGLLTLSDITEILDTVEYPPERRTFIVDVMKRFELCYESDRTFLVPDLLTKQEPDTGLWDDALTFEVKYDVLPTSVISRLIVRMHAAISRSTVWRTGLVIAMDGNRALVKGDREDAVIRIVVDGPGTGRRGLLTAVRAELRAIAQTIPGLAGEERVPVPEHPGVFVPYEHLLELEAAGRETVVPQGVVSDFSVRGLLDGVEAPSARARERGVARAVEVDGMVTAEALTEANPWSPQEAMTFGVQLFAAVILLVGVLVVAELAIGTTAAVIAAVALIGIVALAVIVLRASGRLSEGGFLAAIREVLARTPQDPVG